jgi:DNA-binding HxlR family transcriptional regulator
VEIVETVADQFDVMNPACPSRVILGRIGDRWTIFVVSALADEVLRFTELKNRIGRITPKVLTETLRALEYDGFVSRETFAIVPPRVEYRLTPLGRSLLEPIVTVRRWAERHVPEVMAARAHADELADVLVNAGV